jgi:hypothetical protein
MSGINPSPQEDEQWNIDGTIDINDTGLRKPDNNKELRNTYPMTWMATHQVKKETKANKTRASQIQ